MFLKDIDFVHDLCHEILRLLRFKRYIQIRLQVTKTICMLYLYLMNDMVMKWTVTYFSTYLNLWINSHLKMSYSLYYDFVFWQDFITYWANLTT